VAEQIRVLAVIRHPVGGIRTYLKYTYGSLDRKRYRFTIVTVEDEEGRLVEGDLSGFEVQVFRAQGRWRFAAMVRDIFLLCWNKKVDIIHSHGLTAGVLAVIGNVFVSLSHIITLHGVFMGGEFSGKFGGVTRRLLGWLLSRADVIHCVSEDARINLLTNLPSLARHNSKCLVIPSGVCVEGVYDDGSDHRSALRAELNLDADTIIFGFLGRFMPEKGFTHLIDAIEHLVKEKNLNATVKVLAMNYGAFIREYKAAIEQKKLSRYFIFYGFTPDIERIILGVDAVVIPSLSEACPLVPMEAFVLGCPVIASDCIGLREVVRDTPAVKVTSGDHHCLAKTLAEVIMDRERYKQRALEFVPAARRRFDVSRSAAELDSVFQRLSKA